MEADRHGNAFEGSRNKCDIVSSLPLELVVEVVEYLDQADIVRCQMVQQFRYLALKVILDFNTASLDLEEMALDIPVRHSHQQCFAPNPCGSRC